MKSEKKNIAMDPKKMSGNCGHEKKYNQINHTSVHPFFAERIKEQEQTV